MKPETTIESYISDLSSSSPTPGGGNVSALCGALSSSLGEMVCNLTFGKKKYADAQDELKSIKEELSKHKANFLRLAQKDNDAFDKVMESFRLPKETEDEKNFRNRNIAEATLNAAKVPAEVIRMCGEVVLLLSTVAAKGNQNSLSDTGVAALLLGTASEGAFLNVLINCSAVTGSNEAGKILSQSKTDLELVKSCSNEILTAIYLRLQ